MIKMLEIEINIRAFGYSHGEKTSGQKLFAEVAGQLQDLIKDNSSPRMYLTVNDGEKDVVLPVVSVKDVSMECDHESTSIRFTYYSKTT
jgi:hypothetical protein